MKRSKLVMASAVVVLGLTSATAVWAKPGGQGKGHSADRPDNHGQSVSTVARSKQNDDENHGKAVSEVARSKSKTQKSQSKKSYTNRRYSTQRTTHTSKGKQYGATRSTQVRDAARARNEAIREAQSEFEQTRRAILNDGDRNDPLTRRQRERLDAAIRTRNAAIRNAQELSR